MVEEPLLCSWNFSPDAFSISVFILILDFNIAAFKQNATTAMYDS